MNNPKIVQVATVENGKAVKALHKCNLTIIIKA